MAKKFQSIRRSAAFQRFKKLVLDLRIIILYNLRPYPPEIGENPIFIFNHIPKCGGSSLSTYLRNFFIVKMDYPPHELRYPNREEHQLKLKEFAALRPDFMNLKPWEILSGHYHKPEFEISSRFKGLYTEKRVRLITFIRNPIRHRLSLYYFGLKKGHAYATNITFEEFIITREINFISQSLGLKEDNYKEVLDKYFFIGDVDNFDLSLKTLNKMLGKPELNQVPLINATEKPISELDIDGSILKKFKEVNSLDYLVYDYAKKLSENMINNYN